MTARRPSRPLPPRPVSSRLSHGLLAAAALLTAAGPAFAAVECDRTKKYRLTERHGPWTIMVAAFHPLRGGDPNGTTPEQAADQLVYDLRDQGIPACAWVMPTKTESVATRSRDGEQKEMLYASQRGGVCVMAGNFRRADDEGAQKSLKWVKTECRCPSLMPVAATGWTGLTKNGGFFKLSPGRNGSPLARAFVTVNPLLSDAQKRRLSRRADPLLVRLNAGQEYCLADCPGEYSVVVAQFRGKTLTQVSGTKSADVGRRVALSNDLDDAAKQAWELCQVLRNQEGLEAYLWHDRHRSVVTVGSFASATDPAAVRTARRLAATPGPGGAAPTPKAIIVPKGETDLRNARRYWLLESVPYAMAVPAL